MAATIAMFQAIKKMIGLTPDKGLAFAPLATPFTNEDFEFLNDKLYAEDPARYYSEALEFSQKANSIIKNTNTWEVQGDDYVYDVLTNILERARLIDDPTPTADETERTKAATLKLFNADGTNTAEYEAYKRYESEHNKLAGDIDTHKKTKPDPASAELTKWNADLQSLEQALKDKSIQWSGFGFKDEIDKARRTLEPSQERKDRERFRLQWAGARSFLSSLIAEHVASGSKIIPMTCNPNNLYQYKGTSWTTITLSKPEMANLTKEFKAETTDSALEKLFGNDNFNLESIKFDVCRLRLSRSWLTEDLILNRYWDYPAKVSADEKNDFDGLLPGFVIEFILVKNVIPTLLKTSTDNVGLISKIDNGEKVFLGPFLVTNPHAGNLKDQLHVQTFTSTQLKVLSNSVKPFPDVKTQQGSKNLGVKWLTKLNHQPAAVQDVTSRDIGPERVVRLTPRPTVVDHRTPPVVGTPPPKRAGYVWVNDHWERERADSIKKFSLVGEIADDNGKPLPGVEVSIIDTRSTTTQVDVSDETGKYEIKDVSPGEYLLTIKKNGYTPNQKNIQLNKDLNLGKALLQTDHPIESFFLLGVVYKKLPKLPNPIEAEHYQ